MESDLIRGVSRIQLRLYFILLYLGRPRYYPAAAAQCHLGLIYEAWCLSGLRVPSAGSDAGQDHDRDEIHKIHCHKPH